MDALTRIPYRTRVHNVKIISGCGPPRIHKDSAEAQQLHMVLVAHKIGPEPNNVKPSNYCNRDNTDCGVWFAIARTLVPALTRI